MLSCNKHTEIYWVKNSQSVAKAESINPKNIELIIEKYLTLSLIVWQESVIKLYKTTNDVGRSPEKSAYFIKQDVFSMIFCQNRHGYNWKELLAPFR